MKIINLVILFFIVNSTTAFAVTEKVYRDNKFGFSFHYPSNWTREESSFERTVIKVIDPKKDWECMVNVHDLTPGDPDDPKKISNKETAIEFAKTITSRLNKPRTVIAQPSTIGNQAAVELIYEYEHSNVGVVFPVTTIMFVTIKKPFNYAIACKYLGKYEKTDFKVIFPILNGFILHPTYSK